MSAMPPSRTAEALNESVLVSDTDADAAADAATESSNDTTPSSMQDQVYEQVKALIAEGRIRPGQRLLEAHVVDAFDVGRSPARNALQQLQREGTLRRDASRGFLVAGKAAADDRDTVVALDKMQVSAMARWEPIYRQLESELVTRIMFRSVRVTEERLADHFGVSRTVARDVLARLHSQNLISKNRAGHWIADQISPSRASDFYELRLLLEPHALVQSAKHTPREQLLHADRSLEEAMDRVDRLDGSDVERLERELHVDLMAQCPNAELLRTLAHTHLILSANRYIQDVYHSVTQPETSGVMAQHRDVVQKLLKGDDAGAAEALRLHLTRAKQIWQERYLAVSQTPQTVLPPYFI
jgi:DNA-binding GntR family transcriptional regulator